MSHPAPPASPSVPPDVLADLERRLTRVESFVGVPALERPPRTVVLDRWPAPDERRDPAPGASGPSVGAAGPTSSVVSRPAPSPRALREAESVPAPRRVLDEALVGGRLLAWAGGAALLLALATLFWLGVRDGWLGEGMRCLIGAAASVGLLAAGLRNARAGTAGQASWAMAGTGLAGLYATVAVATTAYGLLPDLLGLAALAGLGVAAAMLSLRWDAQPLAGVGLLGALTAPLLAPVDGLVLPVVVLAMAATALLLRQRPWTWLAVAASVLALPQVVFQVGTLLDGLDAFLGYRGPGPSGASAWDVAAPGLATVVALAAGLAMTAGWELRQPEARERWSMPLLLVAHASVAAALGGAYALVDRPLAAVVTLAASAAVLLVAAVRVHRRAGVGTRVEFVLLSVAALVLDLGFAIATDGLIQLIGWGVTAVAFALIARRAAEARMPLAIGGLGLHAGLTLVQTIAAGMAATASDATFLASIVVFAGVCAVSARVIADRSPLVRGILDLSAIAAATWWASVTVPVDRLALLLAAEAAALLAIDRRIQDAVARGAGLALLAIAAGVALTHADGAAIAAIWGTVPEGAGRDLVLPLLAVVGAAGIGVVALQTAVDRAIRPLTQDDDATVEMLEQGRTTLAVLAGALALVTTSIVAGDLTAGAGGGTDAVAVVRDVLWASTGLALLAVGLIRDERPLRMAGLTLLAGIGLKIALIDLADVDTAGRVVAWAALGALLLVGAGLYARLRPEVEGRDEVEGPGEVDEADLRVAGRKE